MPKYVDGFVIVVPIDKAEEYKKMAEMGRDTWMKYGALEYFECVGDDLKVHPHMGQGFKKLAKLKNDETVIFSFIIYKSKADRDRINKKIMSDPKMKDFDPKDMPVDMKRFVMGGFKVIVKN